MKIDLLEYKKTYCMASAPLLFSVGNFFALLFYLFAAALLGFILLRSLERKSKGSPIFDARFMMTFLLWLAILIFLLTHYFVGHDVNLYIVSYLTAIAFLAVALSLGRKFSLIKVRKAVLVLVFIFLVLFAALSSVNMLKVYTEWQQKQEDLRFEKKVLEILPLRPGMSKTRQSLERLIFNVSSSLPNIRDYYEALLYSAGWQLVEQRTIDLYEGFSFVKNVNGEEVMIELYYLSDGGQMQIFMHNGRQPLSSDFYTLPNWLGGCDEFSWF